MGPMLVAGEPKPGETKRAILACNDYLRLGPGRSLQKLLDRYQTVTGTAPTKRLPSLKDWSRRFGWQERAAAYDAEAERQKNEVLAARRCLIMEQGLALDFERVRHLRRLAVHLGRQVYEMDKLWLLDVKQVGSGENAERVDLTRFNAALVEQYRGALDDLAKETGGRKQKIEHSGKVGMSFSADDAAQAERELDDWRPDGPASTG